MQTKKKRGRPMQSNQVRVIPEFREHPDVEKLARALIAIATDMAKKKEMEAATQADMQKIENGDK